MANRELSSTMNMWPMKIAWLLHRWLLFQTSTQYIVTPGFYDLSTLKVLGKANAVRKRNGTPLRYIVPGTGWLYHFPTQPLVNLACKCMVPRVVNSNAVFCLKSGFSWPCLSWCHEIVLKWFPVAFLRFLVGALVNLSYLFTRHLPRSWLLLMRRTEKWILDNHGVILTHIYWWRTSLFLPWCSEAALAIPYERLATSSYQKCTPSTGWLKAAIQRSHADSSFKLSYPGPRFF